MEEKSDRLNTAVSPPGWPEDVPLPTLEEVQEAVREGEEQIARMHEEYVARLKGSNLEMLNTLISI